MPTMRFEAISNDMTETSRPRVSVVMILAQRVSPALARQIVDQLLPTGHD
jgi:hypothetical protein